MDRVIRGSIEKNRRNWKFVNFFYRRTQMKHFILISILASGIVFAEDSMKCNDATVVLYEPGPNWERFDDYAEKHKSFLKKGMQSGMILFAGPFFKGEKLDGGLTIFSEDDLKKVESLILTDAIVKHKVVLPKLKPWMMCEKEDGNE
jgi:uncharacterized protein YciI